MYYRLHVPTRTYLHVHIITVHIVPELQYFHTSTTLQVTKQNPHVQFYIPDGLPGFTFWDLGLLNIMYIPFPPSPAFRLLDPGIAFRV